MIAAGTLTEIAGIGEAIADIVTKLYETRSQHPSLEKMRKCPQVCLSCSRGSPRPHE
jgi:hypothetical protein